MYKWIAALTLVISAAAVADTCNQFEVAERAKEVHRAARHFERAIAHLHGYKHLSRLAFRLEQDAERLGTAAHNMTPCATLQNEFRAYAEPTFGELRGSHHQAQTHSPNENVKHQWHQLRDAFGGLDRALFTLPPPPPNPCYGLEGNYNGICRVDNSSAASAIAFTVSPQGNACVAANSGYFQPVALAVSAGQGSAAVHQIPGGVAINQTSLTVQGAGRFVMRGYNYAGKFWFTCTPTK